MYEWSVVSDEKILHKFTKNTDFIHLSRCFSRNIPTKYEANQCSGLRVILFKYACYATTKKSISIIR